MTINMNLGCGSFQYAEPQQWRLEGLGQAEKPGRDAQRSVEAD